MQSMFIVEYWQMQGKTIFPILIGHNTQFHMDKAIRSLSPCSASEMGVQLCTWVCALLNWSTWSRAESHLLCTVCHLQSPEAFCMCW